MFETYLLLYEALYLLCFVFIISTVQNNILQQGHPFPAFYPLNANRVSWEDRQLTLGILVTEIPLHYNLQPHSLFGCFKGLLKRKPLCDEGFHIQRLESQRGKCHQLHIVVLKHLSKEQYWNIVSGKLLELDGYGGYLRAQLHKHECPTRVHAADAWPDGGFCPCGRNDNIWLAPQHTFHFTGSFQRGLLSSLLKKISPKLLNFGQLKGK